jgi:hypothetical protein
VEATISFIVGATIRTVAWLTNPILDFIVDLIPDSLLEKAGKAGKRKIAARRARRQARRSPSPLDDLFQGIACAHETRESKVRL